MKIIIKNKSELPIYEQIYNCVVNGNPSSFQPMNANFGILYNADKHHRDRDIENALRLTDEFWAKINE